MSDEMHSLSVELWPTYAQAVSQLFLAVQVHKGQPVLAIQASPSAISMLQVAADAIERQLIVVPADSTPDDLNQQLADLQPAVVVCVPEIFGWASKLAFLNGVSAIYTCGETGEGTLLSRALHGKVTA